MDITGLRCFVGGLKHTGATEISRLVEMVQAFYMAFDVFYL